MSDKNKETADGAAVMEAVDSGEMTLNQARISYGLKPIDHASADKLVKKE
ncbi:MAG: hypothetical protein J7559_16845 [Cohnella sp.]|nr:hypothetical protein [Cohnella sp.]